MTTTKKYVPNLRFPEFNEAWITEELGKCLERVIDPVEVEFETHYREIGVRSHGRGVFHKKLVFGKSLGNKRVFWVHPNSLILNIVFAWEQAVALTTDNEKGFIASHRFPMYVSIKNKVNLRFIFLLFLRKRGKFLLELASPGGAGRNKTLGQSEFAKLKVTLPPFPEQQKIAAFLSSIDTKIEQLNAKKALWGQYKKGMMQKLFSQEIRFKDEQGKDYPDWEKKRLGDIFTIRYGKGHKYLHDGDIPVMGTGGVIRYVDQVLYDQPSVLIGRKGTIDEPQYIEQPFWTIDTLFYTDIKPIHIPFFVFLVASNINWKRYNEATGVPSLNANTIIKIKVDIPSKVEQQKIANFLSAIDQKIELIATEFNQARTFKKGLLQQMFI